MEDIKVNDAIASVNIRTYAKKKRTKCEATAVFCLLRQRSSKYDVIEPKIKTTIASGIHKIVFDIFVDSQIIFNIKLH